MAGPPGLHAARAATVRLLALALAGALAVALAGCTGGSSRRAGGSGGSGGGQGAADRGDPRRGGTLAIALLAPRSLDPAYATRPEEQLVVANLFDGLTAIDPRGAVQPAVAASWSSDPSLRHWRFQLRADARYSDSTPVNAGDFRLAWERLASPRTRPRPPSPAALLEAVQGYRAFAAGRAEHIAGLSAPNPTTLVVDLSEPLADLPAVAANPRLSPVPAQTVAAGAAFGAIPVGNGPFKLTARYSKAKPFELLPSPTYSGRRPDLDRVRVVTVPDEQTAWLAVQHNQVSFAPVPLDQVAAARALEGLSADGRGQPGLLQGPEAGSWSLGFAPRAGPAKDPRWREAVSLAIDRRRIATALAGALSPATGIVPHGVPGAGQAACPACDHDPARAQALLGQVGKASREAVDLAVPATSRDQRIAGLIAADLGKVGIKVRVVAVDPLKYPATLAHPSTMFALADTAAYPRMDAFLWRQFSSRGSANPTGFADPAVDDLLADARANADEPARISLYQQAEATILMDLPVAPVLEQRHSAALAPGVEGFDLTPWGMLDLATVRLTNSPK
ncbi:MAG TPA: ABC transporter substrate-binding protein [Actinomycetota bacterium]|jgi:ABC-type transport system substrate-binding protein|nr:ABC transporter substrate-binding protein [Actinomycetota bacterium]